MSNGKSNVTTCCTSSTIKICQPSSCNSKQTIEKRSKVNNNNNNNNNNDGAQEVIDFYCAWFCPYAQRAWLALEQKNVPYHYIEVNPFDKPVELLNVNPNGCVPALRHNESSVYESLILVEYIDEVFSNDHSTDCSHSLFTKLPTSNCSATAHCAYKRSEEKLWIKFIDSKLIPVFYKMLRYSTIPSKLQDEINKFNELLGKVDGWILTRLNSNTQKSDDNSNNNKSYFTGENNRFGAFEVAFAPWASRFYLLEHYCNYQLPSTTPHFNHWYSDILNHPSIIATSANCAEMIEFYISYASPPKDKRIK